MRTLTFVAAGGTDPGLQREVNEDRFHIDETRGLFVVIDGIGGHAAGGKAADVALSLVRERLERETGPIPDRIREAIAIANNEICRLASTRPEWDGMACVLTIALVKDDSATVGHVGDTRLYKLRHDRIEKITRDHSPVGEREDANELSEFEAMRHPRRNEVYRDVGSEPHQAADPEFVELHQMPFEADAALLLCSDGLTDLVDSASIARTVRQFAGNPQAVVRALVEAANKAGGKDNTTVVYIEGERFAASQLRRAWVPNLASEASSGAGRTFAARKMSTEVTRQEALGSVPVLDTAPRRARLVRGAIVGLLLIVTAFLLYRAGVPLPSFQLPIADPPAAAPAPPHGQLVRQSESIAAALERAEPGSEVVVEPGEYRERLTLKDNVRLVSRVPGGATLRLPTTAADGQPEPAVVAAGLSRAEMVGFRIVGDAKTPLGIGILVAASAFSMVDLEISGASHAGIVFAGGAAAASLVGSHIHDNPGTALTIGSGAAPRIVQNVFSRNGMSQHAPGMFTIDRAAAPLFQRNVFLGVDPDIFAALDGAARARLKSENWFHAFPDLLPVRESSSRSRQGRP